jgi:hypothetical protein
MVTSVKTRFGFSTVCSARLQKYFANGKMKNLFLASVSAGAIVLGTVSNAQAAAVRLDSGFTANTLGRNDDGSTGSVPLGFTVDFFGTTFDNLFVNNNGNVTFGQALKAYTPFGLTTNTGTPIIAPFFADVDTRNFNSGIVQYGTATVDGRQAFGANYFNVGYYPSAADKQNSFQVVLINRADTGAGNFDIEFNYDTIQWETGSASGGTNGFGGSSARVGYSNGTGNPGTFFELAGSGVPGSFLDSNVATGLINNSLGSNVNGRYLFSARNGNVNPNSEPVPEPLTILGSGLALGFGSLMKKHHSRKLKKMSVAE